MIFQTFDEKDKCFMVYKNGTFHKNITPSCTQTWSYARYLKDKDIQYASLFALPHKKSLHDLCPSNKKEEYDKITKRIKAVVKSSHEAGLDLNKICMYDVMPRHLLKEWAEIKTEICKNVFTSYPKPINYDQLLKVTKVITDIKFKTLVVDTSKITPITVQDKNTYKLLKKGAPIVDYDMAKTVTGRLATKKDTFPIMTLAKKYRSVLTPNNDWLFELDFNSCELRTALALLGYDQPEEDLHEWNLKHVFTKAKDRNNAKKRIFSWLYNPNTKDDKVSKIYDRNKLKTLYFKDNKVITPFGREIECDEAHAVSYLIQSTAADILFEQMYEVWEYLNNKKSFIKFCNHDSIMIDLHEDQQYEFNNIKEIFSNTRFGRFRVNFFGGKNWADMKKLYIK